MTRLRTKLTLVMSGLCLATILASSLLVYWIVDRSLRRNLDEALLQVAQTEMASATDVGGVHVHEPGPRLMAPGAVRGYEKFSWVLDPDEGLMAKTHNVPSPAPSLPPGVQSRLVDGLPRFVDLTIRGASVRAVAIGFGIRGRPRLISVVGVPTADVDEATGSVGGLLLAVGAASVLVTFAVAWCLAWSLARPLDQLAIEVVRLNVESPDAHATPRAPYVEVGQVAVAFNDLLDRFRRLLDEREAALAAQRQFVADASHELRTPVSNLRNVLEVTLRRDRSTDEYADAARAALAETRRMGRLVDDLLTLAKSDLGRFDVRLAPISLSNLAREAFDAQTPTARPDVRCEFVGCDGDETMGDADRLRQALDNLIRNALAHAKTTVRVEVVGDEDYVVARVGNDGPELAPEDATRVFERFVRLDHARARDTGGSGLGLPIVRAIADEHGGSVEVECAEGWTWFVLRVPRRQGP